MAKRNTKRTPSRKTASKTSKKSLKHILLPFSFRRIILITTCMALFAFIGSVALTSGRQAVAGINITKGLFVQATVALPAVKGAASYNIYYKKTNENEYINAVRDIPLEVRSYTISYLTKGATYHYRIAAVDALGAEFWWSDEKTLTDVNPM